jgi:hypothetical protein
VVGNGALGKGTIGFAGLGAAPVSVGLDVADEFVG